MYIATGEMIRHIGNGAAVIGHAHIPWENFNLNQLTLDQAMGIVVRPTWSHILGSPYVGPLGVTGTLLSAIYFRKLDPFLRMLALAFVAISLYGLLSAFGTNLGFAYVNFHLPLINRIREAGRHLVLFVIGVSFLSGVGYSLLAQSFTRYKEGDHGRLPIVAGILATVFVGIILSELFHYDYRPLPSRFLIVALAPILFALSRLCRSSRYNNTVSAAVIVSAAGMVIPIWGVSASRSDFNKPINLLSHRVIKDVVSKIDVKDYRMDFRDANLPSRFWGMNASYYGIKSFYNLITPQPYAQFRFSLMADVPHLREMMGARYVLCGPNALPIERGAKPILETEGYRLYENANPTGRLTLVHRIAGFADNEGGFVKIVTKGFDYFSEAYVTRHDFKGARQSLSNEQISADSKDQITNVTNQANRSSSTVESSSASLLILNEWFTPAWKARVNGKNQPVLRVNQWQTGVLLGGGKNRVEFEYRPTLFRVLMILHRITAALFLVFVIFVVVQEQRRITALGSPSITLA
jgi:Bacterial membrane protein YfhO